MQWLREFANSLRSFFRRSREGKQLDEELQFHLERQISQNLAVGMSPQEARYAALRLFGGVQQVKEECREARGVTFLETLVQDVRFGLRTFHRDRGFTAVVVLTLALGIGANTAIFSLINAVLLKMLPVKDPEQLVQLTTRNPLGANDSFSYPAFKELRDSRQTLDGALAFRMLDRMDVEVNGQGGLATGQVVSGDYFSVLGVNTVIGRTITPQDARVSGQGSVAVIGYDYWRGRFALDPAVVGKKVVLNNAPFTIIGVTPPEFYGLQPGERVDVSVPITTMSLVWPEFAATGGPADVLTSPFRNWLHIMARLNAGTTRVQADAGLQTVFRGAMREAAESLSGTPIDNPKVRSTFLETRLQLDPGGQGLAALRQQFSKPLLIIMAIVALLLLVACANVANLMLARANARQKEIVVRLALGADRRRLIRQLITESLVLALGSGLLAVVVASWASRSLLVLMSHSRAHIMLSVRPDGSVLGFTLLISLLTALLFGVVPAWRAVQPELSPGAIQSARNIGQAGARSRLGKMLVIVQVAVTLVLMIGAGLLAHSLANLKDFYPGFDKGNVLLFSVNPHVIGYPETQLVSLYGRLLERLGAIPGVHSVTLSVHSPLSGGFSTTFVDIEGGKATAEQNVTPPFVELVGPNYFKTIAIPILHGRDFTASDRDGSPKVAAVNETMRRRYFGDLDPIGRRISIPGYRGDSSWLEIVAVVKDSKFQNLREQTAPMVYIPLFQAPESGVTFEIRTATDPASASTAILRAVHATDGRLPAFGVETLSEQLNDSLIEERLVASLSGMFGVLAVVLASVGLYGLMAYAVSRRTNEIGLRVALGAQRGQILGMIIRETLLLVGAGLVIGVPTALGACRLISSELYGLKPGDPLTVSLAVLLMIAVALFAGYLPARRASHVDPMVALRYE
jgi:predicted permease